MYIHRYPVVLSIAFQVSRKARHLRSTMKMVGRAMIPGQPPHNM